MVLVERVADPDDPLRSQLRAARAWRVPPTVFLGLRTVDTAGWTSSDTSYAMALEVFEARLCGGCGDDLAVTTAPENWGRYRASLPVRCHKCTASMQAAEAREDTPQPGALMFPVELKPPDTEPDTP